MAKGAKSGCPYGCPLCRFYQAGGAIQEEIWRCVPPDVARHLNGAARELLLAARALLEEGLGAWIQGPKAGPRRKAQRVKVE